MLKILRLFLLGIVLIAGQSCHEAHHFDNVKSLCQNLAPSKSIIGLGESTHGTKEFNTIRSEIVKDLVENYSYRLFILEAEYIACAKINKYILTGKGDPKLLLNEIVLWPWINQSFLDLIIWMKHFNENNQDDPIQFFGMDMQFYNSYLSTIEYNYPEELVSQYRMLTNDSLLSKYPSKGQLILEIDNSEIGTEEKVREFQSLSKSFLNDELTLRYYLLTRMYNLSLSEPKDLNARDKYMAELVEMIQSRSGRKAIIWAHNWHISRLHDPELNYISAGYHISNIYKDEYSVIGFDFQKGSFNAISIAESKRRAFKYQKIAETLSSDLIFGTKEYLITDCSSLESECYVNSIGATYVDEPTDVERYYSKIHKNIEFDYFISIPESSPSVLISSF